jgi:hypothetical protein
MAVTAHTVTNEVNVGMTFVGRPVTSEVFEKGGPVGQKPMDVEVLLRKGERMVDPNESRLPLGDAFNQPSSDAASRPVLPGARRRSEFDRF